MAPASTDVVPLLSPPPPLAPPSVSEPVEEAPSADSDELLIMSEPAEVGVEVIMVMLALPIIIEGEGVMLESAIIIVEEEVIILAPVAMAAPESMAEVAILVALEETLVSRLAIALGPPDVSAPPPEPTPP